MEDSNEANKIAELVALKDTTEKALDILSNLKTKHRVFNKQTSIIEELPTATNAKN